MRIPEGIRRIAVAFLPLALAAEVATGGGACQANCYLVNTASDTVNPSCDVSGTGTCSLRDALTKMALSSNNVIQFAIGTGQQTISLLSDLPDILLPVMIDGTTQPGFAGVPLIQIRRGDAGTALHGLRTRGPATNTLILKAVNISHFNEVACSVCAAIILSDLSDLVRPGGHTIQGCYIGTDPTGMVADGNTYGIQDNSEGGNTFGGTTTADRNVISGNASGIVIGFPGPPYSVQSLIQGNYIGTDATGTTLLPNTYGIWTGPPYPGFSPGILIGGSEPGAGNVIAGNGNSIQMNNGINNVIQGNLIGLDATGMNKLGTEDGIILDSETNAAILNNVIAGATGAGIYLSYDAGTLGPTHGTVIQGNYIGTDITGNRALSTGGYGIWIAGGAPNNTIGGSAAGQGNVIGGLGDGVYVSGGGFAGPSTGNVIQGNRIGVGIGGAPIPNSSQGIILISSDGGTIVGGINPGEGNLIAMNTSIPGFLSPGILVGAGSGNVIRGNSIYGNSGLGIDFDFPFASYPHANDPGDADTGPNGLQNFPILTYVGFPDLGHVRIQGTLNSMAVTHYTLDFYANPTPVHPTDFLQGQTWIGLFDNPAVTDGQGNLAFDVTLPVSGAPNVWVSVTATDDAGDTSEFSQRSLFAISPTHGPAAAGIGFLLTGQLFQAGATVGFDGLLATGVNVGSATQMSGLTPALAAGALYDVTVTNPDSSTAVMQRAYLVDFNDVLSGSNFYPFVTSLASDGVTGGCGGGNYCPGNPVTRAQMAVFLLKAKYGAWWVPPLATGAVFLDVSSSSFAADWIEELYHQGITGGCGGGNYCPGNSVTRQQMAVFLLKAEHGSSYAPPACAAIFGDVTCPSLFADWIEQLYNEAVTGGCSASPLLYCPTSSVTRGQMAVFVTKTFHLP